MLNLLTSSQTRDADAYTIATAPISSINLMESASLAFVEEFKKEVSDINIPIGIFCGTGNNGGDGLAIARLLKQDGFLDIEVIIFRFSDKTSKDFTVNLNRLIEVNIPVREISTLLQLPNIQYDICIDALLGSGLNKPIDGELAAIIKHINHTSKQIISVDVPSGFPSEGILSSSATSIQSKLTISFQRPKINFFFPESAAFVGRFKFAPIGLDERYIQSLPSHWKFVQKQDIELALKPREPFSHKGTYGHALIIAGKTETMGAALLCADACLHSGAGLTTACIPETGLTALNVRSPEIMALIRKDHPSTYDFSKYSAIAIGPGLGTDEVSIGILKEIITLQNTPIVLDADALTMLSQNRELLEALPATTIITPHMKEFDRMFGDHKSWWERVETAQLKATELNIIIVLKNRYTFIVSPGGDVLVNPTGNPAMAVGGMGDVLTGMIVSFLTQGYSSKDSAMIACYIHGEAGDELKHEGMNSVLPGKLVERLPYVIGSFTSS